MKQHGMLGAPGTLGDLSGLTVTDEEARALVRAGSGDEINCSTEEQASFKALRGQSTQAVLEQLHRMLLARSQSYRASGLNGIASHDRGNGGGGDVAGDAEARAVVRREFYVSTGYNAEQSIAGFLPVTGGTAVLCMSHAFTDQVAGSGGSMKRSIGSRVMADEMKEIFERGRKRLAAKP